MKNFFELFGFLSMACISAAIIFIFMGKKDALNGFSKDNLLSEYSIAPETPNAPRAVTKGIRDSYASDSGSARRAKNSNEKAAPALSNVEAEDRLKMLYRDATFVAKTVQHWKSAVADMADEYNVKPQLLLASVVVQSYLGDYSRRQLKADAAQHAGDRVMPVATAAKRYKYGWSTQKIMDQYKLGRYFAAEIPTAAATSPSMVSSINNASSAAGTSKSGSSKVTPTAKTNPLESGFQNMVAKEYGFSSWNGLQRLSDAEMKSKAQRRVKSLLMAARIK